MQTPRAFRFLRRAAWLSLPFVSAPLQAHPAAAGIAGFDTGLAHACSGADHLLAVLAVGMWAAQLGGRGRWALPLSFVATMIVGGALAAFALPAAPLPWTLALSVVALGAAMFHGGRLPAAGPVALVGAFGLLHGWAHAAEMPAVASATGYGAGLALATAALHGVGLVIGLALRRRLAPVLRAGGGAIALAGAGLLLL